MRSSSSPFAVLKDGKLFVNNIEDSLGTRRRALLENVWIEPNGGYIDIFLVVFESAVEYEQMSLIREWE
jgi:hypothetical protein